MKSRVSRLLFAVVLVVAVLLCALPMGVAADRNFWSPIPWGAFESDTCGFTLQFQPTHVNHWVKWFFDGRGNFLRVVANGVVNGTFTREDTGQSIKANISEVAIYTLDEDGSVILDETGCQWWDFGLYGQTPPDGLPKVGIYNGHMVMKLDPDTLAPLEFISFDGHVTDLCAQFPDP